MITPAKPVPMNRRLLNKRAANSVIHLGAIKKQV
jgi:hypothetical protein